MEEYPLTKEVDSTMEKHENKTIQKIRQEQAERKKRVKAFLALDPEKRGVHYDS